VIAVGDRQVAAVTLVAGTATLAATLAAPRGSAAFAVLGFAVAAIWLVGAALGPRPRVRPLTARGAAAAVGLGVVAYAGFVAVSYVARLVPVLNDGIDSVLTTADAGPTPVILAIAGLNAIAEEQFFRGALPTVVTPTVATALYVATTAATLNLSLVAAGIVMGPLLMRQRLATTSTTAPTITHLTWSTFMLLAFPT
jgi:hypothetical protein